MIFTTALTMLGGFKMDKHEFYAKMREEVNEYASGRDDSSAFLIWFLENYFRIESQDAIDSVCDHTNDKGIDGIFIDDEDEIIYLFQSKFSPSNTQDQGDNDIRNFIGAREWLSDENRLIKLLSSTASHELKSLVESLGIQEKTKFKITSVFVTNKIFNKHAREYIGVAQCLESYDGNDLFEKYTFFAEQNISHSPKELFISNDTKINYCLPDGTKAQVYSIRAKELIKLDGIQDRTLFYRNVRYYVGNTRVNKSLKQTIRNTDEHNNFFLYHNGVTILCEDIIEDALNNKITISDYAVINGCQSMLSFFENKDNLSNNLFVLTKIIKLRRSSPLIKKITIYANNQNSISIKDLRSNDSVQKQLQEEFKKLFDNTVLYKRKKGEEESGYNEIIEKDFGAQIVEAIYRDSPHNTHLKQKLFGEDYTKIFSRKINAQNIYLGKIIYDIVKENSNMLSNEKLRDYGLAIFFFAYSLSVIMREDDIGKEILQNPDNFIKNQQTALRSTLKRIWELITPDINSNLEEYTTENNNFFDYKNVFKNSLFVQKISTKTKNDYIRLTRRNFGDSFKNIFNSYAQ